MHKEGFEKLVRNNTLDCLYPYILKILSEKPTHAYVLRKKIEDEFGFRPGNVTAYRVLYSLKKEGLVNKTDNGRIKVYKVTSKGKKELERVLEFYMKQIKVLE